MRFITVNTLSTAAPQTPVKVDSMKKSLVLFFIFTSIFTADVLGQTRRRTPAPRRSRRIATSPRVARPPVVTAPCASSSATTTPSGLTVMVTRQGTGQMLKNGDMVLVHYTGLLTDGTKFDSSRDRGQPIEFELGAGRVIKGWDEGVARLRVGDQATLLFRRNSVTGKEARETPFRRVRRWYSLSKSSRQKQSLQVRLKASERAMNSRRNLYLSNLSGISAAT
jgi:peptidylprolyl isomerase